MLSDLLDDSLGGFCVEVMGIEDDGCDEWDLKWLFNESRDISVSSGSESMERTNVLIPRC